MQVNGFFAVFRREFHIFRANGILFHFWIVLHGIQLTRKFCLEFLRSKLNNDRERNNKKIEIIFQWSENWIYINKRNHNQSVFNFQRRIRTSKSFECNHTIYWNLNVKLMFVRKDAAHDECVRISTDVVRTLTSTCGGNDDCVHISIRFIGFSCHFVSLHVFTSHPVTRLLASSASSPSCIIEILIFNLCATTFQTHPYTMEVCALCSQPK